MTTPEIPLVPKHVQMLSTLRDIHMPMLYLRGKKILLNQLAYNGKRRDYFQRPVKMRSGRFWHIYTATNFIGMYPPPLSIYCFLHSKGSSKGPFLPVIKFASLYKEL